MGDAGDDGWHVVSYHSSAIVEEEKQLEEWVSCAACSLLAFG
jgi:hypothetical protein